MAAKIIVVGMRDGIFTGKSLNDCFNKSVTDWINARRIINGLDRASEIASYATRSSLRGKQVRLGNKDDQGSSKGSKGESRRIPRRRVGA